jgi:hypothetical protein
MDTQEENRRKFSYLECNVSGVEKLRFGNQLVRAIGAIGLPAIWLQ